MYTHSFSFNTDICLHIHSAECTVRLLKVNQAGRNNYPYNPQYVGNTGNRTRDGLLDKCISNQQLYQLSYSTENKFFNSVFVKRFNKHEACVFLEILKYSSRHCETPKLIQIVKI